MRNQSERRQFGVRDFAIRRSATPSLSAGTLTGYAAVFNEMSGNLGGFKEIIKPGAFSSAIRISDIRALWNHQDNLVLGRTKSGTLRVKEDARGLYVEIDLPSTSTGRDAAESIRRGDVDQMSFAFTIPEGGDSWQDGPDGSVTRTIWKVKELFDVSPVTYPAYEATTVSVRKLLRDRGLNPDRVLGPTRAQRLGQMRFRRAQLGLRAIRLDDELHAVRHQKAMLEIEMRSLEE